MIEQVFLPTTTTYRPVEYDMNPTAVKDRIAHRNEATTAALDALNQRLNEGYSIQSVTPLTTENGQAIHYLLWKADPAELPGVTDPVPSPRP